MTAPNLPNGRQVGAVPVLKFIYLNKTVRLE